jgi:adenosylcobinamide-phosphate synthase
MHVTVSLSILMAALLIEAAFGYPQPVYAAIRHPVVWFGWLIDGLDGLLNQDTANEDARRMGGVLALAVVLLAALAPSVVIQSVALRLLPFAGAVVLVGLIASSLLAQRSLWTHVAGVAEALETGGLLAGRQAVSHVVGRDPDRLDEAGVARAAIESLGENFSDAVVAPAFWCALFGLPGLAAYKAVNTADSMIGHTSPRHLAFGWAAARLDDLVNLPGSRLSALWIALACLVTRDDLAGAVRAVLRDARHHKSPNAGWPESAIAGALGLRLAGPRVYDGTLVDDHWMGEGRAEASAADIRRALSLYRAACAVQIVVVALLLAVIARG